jgi:hypothetical protein
LTNTLLKGINKVMKEKKIIPEEKLLRALIKKHGMIRIPL